MICFLDARASSAFRTNFSARRKRSSEPIGGGEYPEKLAAISFQPEALHSSVRLSAAVSPRAFLHALPNLMSYFRLIHTPHTTPLREASSLYRGSLTGEECDQGGRREEGRARVRLLRKGEGRESEGKEKSNKQGPKSPDPNLESRWAVYFRSVSMPRYGPWRPLWKSLMKTGAQVVGGGLKRDTRNGISGLGELRANGGRRQAKVGLLVRFLTWRRVYILLLPSRVVGCGGVLCVGDGTQLPHL